MTTCLRRTAVAVAALTVAIGFGACGKAGQSGGPGGNETGKGIKIGLLLPDNQTARWENFDKPLIESRLKQLCRNCPVEYANARQDVATQQQQVDSMITKGVDVLMLNPVDARSLRSSVEKADRAHIPVVSYDRLAEGPISAYVSFDNDQVGRLQGQALLQALGAKAAGSQIVMINGPRTDPNAIQYTNGALSVLRGKVRIGKSYETDGWKPENANTNMSGAIAALGADNIDGVYAGNDALAAGVISALQAARVHPLPPITGQDAELSAIQRIVAGDQYMSVYKPFKPEADAGAAMAVALGRHESLDDIATDRVSNRTAKGVPAVLLTPISVTARNVRDTVVKDGMYTIDEICTPKYRPACDRAGLTS